MNKNKTEQLDFIDFTNDNNSNDMTITDILGVVWRNRFWFALSIVIALFIAIIYVKSTPKTYSRSATILIKDDKKGGGVISEAAAFQDMFSVGSSSVYNEIGILKSRRLMMQVVEQLKLETNYQIKDGLMIKDLYTLSPIEIEYIGEVLKQEVFKLFVTPLGDNKAQISYTISEVDLDGDVTDSTIVKNIEMNSEFDFMHGRIKIKPTLFMGREYIGKQIIVTKDNVIDVAKLYGTMLTVENSDKQSTLVSISIIDPNTQRAEDIINTLINVYEKTVIDNKNKVLNSTITFIAEKIDIIENDLRLIDSDIEEYKKKNKLTDIFSVSSMYLENYSRIDAESLGLENQLNVANYMKDYLNNNANQTELIPVNIGINNSGVESQITKYNEAMTMLNKLLTNSTPNNPIVHNLQNSLVSMRSSILRAVDNLIASLKIQVQKYNSEEQKSSSKIANVSSQHKYMINIERQLKIKEELYLYLLKKQEESEIQLTTTKSNCIIVDVADGDIKPVDPKTTLALLIIFIFGFIIPAICIYVRSVLNTNLYTKKEIKSNIDIPIVGELPLEKIKDKKQNIVVEDGNRNIINEAFRILRDNIDMMSVNDCEKGKVILLTSFNPSAGKTFITSNLAITMSLSNSKVILLDLDLRKASLTKRLGFDKKQAGISTYLSGKINKVEDIINKYDDSGLSVISSGTIPPNPAELLKNDRLGKLIAELKEKYDYIIIDSAPYGLVTDTSMCAKYADITILSIRSGKFDKRQLPALEDLYKSNKLPNLCVILNAIDIDKFGCGYSYGYGYGYGSEVTKNFRYYMKKITGI